MTKNLRSKVNENFSRANQYVHRWGYLIVPVTIICALSMVVFFAADYALAYSFFSKLAENGLGVVPTGMKSAVVLKATLAVAAAVVVKFTFSKMSKGLRRFIAVCLFVGSIFIVIHMGRAQIIPVMIDTVERIFPGDVDIRAELGDLFVDEGVVDEQDHPDITPEAKEKISKSHYIIEFDYYGYAYLLMTFAGVFAWIGLSSFYSRMQRLNQVNKAFLKRHKQLIQKEQKKRLATEAKAHLESCQKLICRGAQDIAVNAYCAGLAVPKKQVGDLKIYGDLNGELKRKYHYWQTIRVSRLNLLNIEVTEKMILQADKSLMDLDLIDINSDNVPGRENIRKLKQFKGGAL